MTGAASRATWPDRAPDRPVVAKPPTRGHTGIHGAGAPDAASMALGERIAELGVYLAAGYRRLRLRQKELDAGAAAERPCASVDSPENANDEEAA